MRSLLFSDIHLSVDSRPEDERWFPPFVAKMSSARAETYLAEWDRKTASAFQNLLIRAQKFGPYDLIVSLGDNTSGNNERGMIAEKARKQWQSFSQKLGATFSSVPQKFVWGGHETGYLHRRIKGLPWFKPEKLIGVKKDVGPTKQSFEAASKMVGPMWQEFNLGGFTFLLLNSEVIRAHRESLNPDIQDFAGELAEEQCRFVSQTLAGAEKAILVIHDATQLKYLRSCLAPHLPLGKIKLTLVGHFHLPLFGRFFALQPFVRRLNLKVVPSSLGWMTPWGVVKGKSTFCVLEITPKGGLRLSYCS